MTTHDEKRCPCRYCDGARPAPPPTPVDVFLLTLQATAIDAETSDADAASVRLWLDRCDLGKLPVSGCA